MIPVILSYRGGVTPNTGGGSGNSDNGNGNGNGETPPNPCSSEYIWDSSNCHGNKEPSGGQCGGKYNQCTCLAEYQYDESNCTSPNVPQGSQCEGKYNQCACPLFDGQGNTSAIVGQLGCVDYMAACETTKYYPTNVSASDSHFGQGHWYLPAIGELYQLYTVKSTINSALSGISATTLHTGSSNDYYWSSSEFDYHDSWFLRMSNGSRSTLAKRNPSYVRSFLLCENCFTSLPLSRAPRPVIGDIVYSDLSYDSYTIPHTDKTPVGVVVWVSSSGTTARLVSLDELVNGPMYSQNRWSGSAINITNIPDITSLDGCSWTIPE